MLFFHRVFVPSQAAEQNHRLRLRLGLWNGLFHVTYKATNKVLYSHPCMEIAVLHSARGNMLKGLTSAECQTRPRHQAGELGLIARTNGRPL